ncbi:MAG: Type secretion system pilin [Candidatus Parcubacteria bacterium]|jgi:cytochrome bd-type quinol oxidase subunit 2
MKNNSPIRRGLARAAAVGGLITAMALPFATSAQTALQNLRIGLNATSNAAGITTTKSLPELIGSFIAAALGLLGVILVVLVVYAGFIWMTAQGNDEKIKKAKGMITSAVIGMIIIFAAYAITNFVVGALGTSLGTP